LGARSGADHISKLLNIPTIPCQQDLKAKKIRMSDEEMVNGEGPSVEIDEDLHSRQASGIHL